MEILEQASSYWIWWATFYRTSAAAGHVQNNRREWRKQRKKQLSCRIQPATAGDRCGHQELLNS